MNRLHVAYTMIKEIPGSVGSLLTFHTQTDQQVQPKCDESTLLMSYHIIFSLWLQYIGHHDISLWKAITVETNWNIRTRPTHVPQVCLSKEYPLDCDVCIRWRIGISRADTFSPGWMLRPRDRRMDTLGLGWGQIMNSISRRESNLFTWLGRRTWLPASRCCPWWRSASARQRRCSQSLASDQPLRRFAGPATFVPAFSTKWVLSETGNCTKTKIFTWTSITLISIKAVTEIPIMAPPFKTRTATCVIMAAVKHI